MLGNLLLDTIPCTINSLVANTFSISIETIMMDIVTITITAGTLITIIIYAMSDLRLLQWRGSVKWPVDKPQHFHLLCPTSCPVTLPPTNYPVHPTRYNWKVQRTAAQTTHSLSQKPLPLSTTQSTQYNEEEPV